MNQTSRPRVALAGSPCGLRMSCAECIARMHGERAFRVPDAMKLIHDQHGFRPPKDEGAKTRFIWLVSELQITLEDLAEGQQIDSNLVLIEAGLPDLAVFLDGGLSQLQESMGLERGDVHSRYDLVLFFELPPRHVYEQIRATSEACPSFDVALVQSERALQAWDGHDNLHRIPASIPSEHQETLILRIIGEFMDSESSPSTSAAAL